MRSASMSSPESVSSRIASLRLEHRHLQDLVALLLAAREAGVHRAREHRRIHVHELRASRPSGRRTRADRSPPRRAPSGSRCTPRAGSTRCVTPGISTGYWNARKMPCCARTSGSISSRSSPSYVTAPPVTSYAGCPGEHLRQRALAGPVRAHDRVHLAGVDGEVDALEDRLSPTVAWRFLISSIDSLRDVRSVVGCGGHWVSDGADRLRTQSRQRSAVQPATAVLRRLSRPTLPA